MRRVIALVFAAAPLAACLPVDAEEAGAPDAAVGSGGKADGPADGDDAWQEALARCAPPTADEPGIYYSDFRWGYTLPEMSARFAEIYTSGKRLRGRAYLDEDRGELLLDLPASWGGPAVLPRRFVESVRSHIEQGLAHGYVQDIFFPDMGHAHFHIPAQKWELVYRGMPVSRNAERYSMLLDDPDLEVLYHTAEQLEMLDDERQVLADRQVQWRFYTRNLVGDNRGAGRLVLLHEPSSAANTARDRDGYHYYGAGFYVSASRDGCFRYVHDGQVRYFDLSLSSMPAAPGY
jgi:hypothetical protein